jgi:hypothetical protein
MILDDNQSFYDGVLQRAHLYINSYEGQEMVPQKQDI